MRVPVVIYDEDMTRHVIGEVDVYGASWHVGIPNDMKIELDWAVLDSSVEFVFNRIPGKEHRSITLRKDTDSWVDTDENQGVDRGASEAGS
jgi:hypothetical protein